MRKSRGVTRLLLASLCALSGLVDAEAGQPVTGKPPFEAWREWQAKHPLPLAEHDSAEEAIIGQVFASHSLAEAREALVQREVRREFLRLVALIGYREHWKRVVPTAFRPEALVREGDRDPVDFVLRTTRALLEDLERHGPVGQECSTCDTRFWPAAERDLAALEKQAAALDVKRKADRFDLFRRVCALRRRIAFSNPLLDFSAIVFVKRRLAAANHMCDQYYGNFARSSPRAGLFLLEGSFGGSPRVKNLLEGSTVEDGRLRGRALAGGSFLQPALSYDGKTVLFAHAEGPSADPTWGVEMKERPPWAAETSYHVFRVNVDGTRLTQLTDGPWNDLHPNWLPDGRIVFISERRGGFGRCHGRPVPLYTLHAMDADGRNLLRLSHHEANEWHPSVDGSGMIIYSRWDYVDRGHNQAHHPWTTTPDGRNPRAVHGNFKPSHDLNPDMELNVAAIPGSHRYVATASAHHWQAYGSLIVIDPRTPDDDALAPVRRLTPDVGFPETAEGGQYAYGTAWPLSENYYLCVYSPGSDGHGIYLLDAFGNRELLYRDPDIGCLGPVPVKQRPAPPIVPAVGEPVRLADNPVFHVVGDEHAAGPARDRTDQRGIVGLINVYDSLHQFPQGVKVVALRIVHILPKSTPLHHEPQIGYGAETGGRAILGTVPVEDDGSACFYLPPGMPVYFQAIDARGCAVQSMRSATYVHGGERLTCVGCHERKGRTPPLAAAGVPRAFCRDPSEIRPEVSGSNPVSFPRLVQPVLEKHCVTCHGKDNHVPPDLRIGDWQDDRFHWYLSYRNLRPYAFHYGAARDQRQTHQYDRWAPARTVPGKFGARASRLLALLDQGHYQVKLSPEELRRVVLWLDANSDFFGAYEDTTAQARGEPVPAKLQ